MKDDECNILQHLSREEYREFRTLVIDMVLATDMSFHFQQLKNMRNLLSLAEPLYVYTLRYCYCWSLFIDQTCLR